MSLHFSLCLDLRALRPCARYAFFCCFFPSLHISIHVRLSLCAFAVSRLPVQRYHMRQHVVDARREMGEEAAALPIDTPLEGGLTVGDVPHRMATLGRPKEKVVLLPPGQPAPQGFVPLPPPKVSP